MTQEQKIIRAKVGLLELAKQLGNVSQACKMMGYSRDSFYRFKELYDKGGELALQEISRKQAGPEEPHPGRDRDGGCRDRDRAAGLGPSARGRGPEAARAVDFARRGALRVAAPRSHPMKLRLKALEAKVAQDGVSVDRDADRGVEKAKADKEAHGEFESECPGYCGAQDTFYVGTLKGVGRIYQQTVIDTYGKVAFAKLYDRKTPITAADLLNDRVVPFFDEHGIRLSPHAD